MDVFEPVPHKSSAGWRLANSSLVRFCSALCSISLSKDFLSVVVMSPCIYKLCFYSRNSNHRDENAWKSFKNYKITKFALPVPLPNSITFFPLKKFAPSDSTYLFIKYLQKNLVTDIKPILHPTLEIQALQIP